MRGSGLRAMRKSIGALLFDSGQPITLDRGTKSSDGAGGYIEASNLLDPQDFQFIRPLPISQGTGNDEVIVETGTLLGAHTADLEVGDEFTLDNLRYEVDAIDADRSYRVLAHVRLKGAV